jgi:hypothetical protein
VLAKLPEEPLVIHCTKDQPPTVEMVWPKQDENVTPTQELKIRATLRDDWGIASYRILTAATADAAMTSAGDVKLAAPATTFDLAYPLVLPDEARRHGESVFVQIEATDNRDLNAAMKDGGPQTVTGPKVQLRFQDPAKIEQEAQERADKLRQRLMEMLASQKQLNEQTVAFKPGDGSGLTPVSQGQTALRATMLQTAETFEFDDQSRIIQKTLLVMAATPAKEAVDLSAAVLTEPVAAEQGKLSLQLQSQQRRIISTLESLLAVLNATPEPGAAATTRESGVMPIKPDALSKLDEALKEYMKEQQRILDQTAPLAKKPVDDYDDADKKKLADLQQAQDNLDSFMQEAISDFSKNAEQDLSNPGLLKDLMQTYAEVTMAKDALKQQAAETAVPLEENGLEGAKELTSNIERWLSNTPDRTNWTQEDPTAKTDTPMPELPASLQDMVGELMEQEEDLLDQAEDANANWQDSMNKGVGWDAADGPIADMSAKGVTGNALPNNNEMQGRSGEGRSGKSQGEFVGDTAVGKGGRDTPTRLDPTAFEKGQITDTSKDPVGGATGGGKMSGEGGEGLEGPVPPAMSQEMQRLATKQADIRNKAERLNLQYQLGRYDNFKMMQSIALMRRVESDLDANRYQNALRRRDVLLDTMGSSDLLLGGQISVQQDTTPTGDHKTQEQINDAMKGTLPAAWSDALKQYYQKMGQE